jgi:hypothetical protein
MVAAGFPPSYISVESVTINKEQVEFVKNLRKKMVEWEINVPLRIYSPKISKNVRIKDELEPIMSQKGIKFRSDLPEPQLHRTMEKQFLDFPN